MTPARAARRLLLVLAPMAAVAMLSGCGGDDNKTSTPTPTPPSARLEDSFGTAFGTTFRATATAEPTDPAAGAVNPVTATAEPVAVN